MPRLTSVILILCHAIGQMAIVPHAHAEDLLHSHRVVEPHIHVGHHHGNHCSHDHHVHRCVKVAQVDVEAFRAATDHDSDAIYLPGVSAAVRADLSRLLVQSDLVQWLSSADILLAASHPVPNSACIDRQYRTLKSSVWHCAPFLEACSLRI